ncbi:MAG: NADP(H)-dependent aldo-keto reductase [Sneathiella sp.]|uniref:NADP(H)-dependent aldo-keto reductase n=1 Tax=Sneathiella sp. TaxID=1964365 RepID=UPI003001954C
MKYRKLGRSDLDVSVVCLGTMTWGEQNSEADAHAQMDLALDMGINFLDTAELYPIPPREETQGLSEKHIGSWHTSRKARDKVIIASKAVGPTDTLYFRGEPTKLKARHLEEGIDKSLKNLQTDYIDLYQLHWPERSTNYFGKLGYEHVENEDDTPLLETLTALGDLVKSGKIRQIGISNESAWGIMHYLHLAEQHNLPRMASVQNPYSLLNRTYEVGSAEVSIREQCGLLAYSPSAMGVLSGKYLNGAKPVGARHTVYDRFKRYTTDLADEMAGKYFALAQANDLNPIQMALAFVNSRQFVTSSIIGATTLDQLKENIDSIDLELSDDIIAEIDKIHMMHPYPCP